MEVSKQINIITRSRNECESHKYIQDKSKKQELAQSLINLLSTYPFSENTTSVTFFEASLYVHAAKWSLAMYQNNDTQFNSDFVFKIVTDALVLAFNLLNNTTNGSK